MPYMREPRRTLTSAWIETTKIPPSTTTSAVALSRVRGLKPEVTASAQEVPGRTLTSAWIETGS